jgi:hypothetical protein
MTPEDLVGSRYGSLVVREIAFRHEHWSRTEYYCDCDCGNVCEKTGAALARLGKVSCKACVEGKHTEPDYLPTQAEIKAMCEEIRKGWSGSERSERFRREPHWTVPSVRVRGIE